MVCQINYFGKALLSHSRLFFDYLSMILWFFSSPFYLCLFTLGFIFLIFVVKTLVVLSLWSHTHCILHYDPLIGSAITETIFLLNYWIENKLNTTISKRRSSQVRENSLDSPINNDKWNIPTLFPPPYITDSDSLVSLYNLSLPSYNNSRLNLCSLCQVIWHFSSQPSGIDF